MKRIAWVLFLCITLVGCDKNNAVIPVVEPPVTTVQPKVVLSITPDGVVLPYGSRIVINWSATNAKLCILNGETIQTFGNKEVQLFADAKYNIVAQYDQFSSAPIEKSVKVGDWTTSDLGLISQGEWMVKSIRYLRDGIVLADLNIDQQKKDRTIFTLDGKVMFNGQFSCDWKFTTPGRIIVGSQDCSYALTKTEFARSMVSQHGGQPAIYEVTLVRI